jgi:hypothetical protein
MGSSQRISKFTTPILLGEGILLLKKRVVSKIAFFFSKKEF